MHIMSFKYLPEAWSLIYGKKMASNAIDMELKNTVFLIAPVQFSVVRIVILFIQFSNTVQNTLYYFCHVHVFFLLISRDFMKFY